MTMLAWQRSTHRWWINWPTSSRRWKNPELLLCFQTERSAATVPQSCAVARGPTWWSASLASCPAWFSHSRISAWSRASTASTGNATIGRARSRSSRRVIRRCTTRHSSPTVCSDGRPAPWWPYTGTPSRARRTRRRRACRAPRRRQRSLPRTTTAVCCNCCQTTPTRSLTASCVEITDSCWWEKMPAPYRIPSTASNRISSHRKTMIMTKRHTQ